MDDDRASRTERREIRRRAVRRRRIVALTLSVAALAGIGVAAVMATRGSGQEEASGAASSAATPRTEPAPSSQTEPVAATTESGPPANAKVTFAAVGDTVMGTPAYGLPPDGGESFFADVASELDGDVVMVNLEGTLSTNEGSKCGAESTDCFAFQTPPSYARWLAGAGFTVANLANNHAYDFGPDGQRETIAALRRNGVRVTGPPGRITIQRVGEVRVAVVGFASYPWANDLTDVEGARRLVRKAAKKADLVVVTFHGGAEGSDQQHVPDGTEYFLGENRGDLRTFSHAVVDAGADLVIGHGPHVLRGMEWYKKRLIAYSLGNFAGYGVFSLAGPTAISGILRVTVRADGSWVKGVLVPTALVGEGLPVLDPAEQAHGIVRGLSRDDFGRRGIRVTPTGVLVPPAR
jgi:hypothetical protein